MRYLLILAILMPTATAWSQHSSNANIVSCWDGKSLRPRSKTVTTPTLTSSTGYKAYAINQANAISDDCASFSRLFIAAAKSGFTIVYQRGEPEASNGTQIRLASWSPEGKYLLGEVVDWTWESDTGFEKVPFVFTTDTMHVSELPAVDVALTKFYGKQCEFDLFALGWMSKDTIRVKVTKTPPNETYDQKFCVSKPRFFGFNLTTQKLKPEPSATGKRTK